MGLTNAHRECKMGLNGYLTPFFQSDWGVGMSYGIAKLSIHQPLTATGPLAKKVRTWLERRHGIGAGRVLAGPSFFQR
jgi:hypothetical protein